ncbi:hypothetical protein [Scytonema hofmannii]|nr:hypothetical protein [Scytonema hofmannii]
MVGIILTEAVPLVYSINSPNKKTEEDTPEMQSFNASVFLPNFAFD